MKPILISALAGFLICSSALAEDLSANCAPVKRDRIYELFGHLRSQTVFRNRQLVGWRIYAPDDIQQGLGLRPMDLVTHICGVGVGELVKRDGDICCTSVAQDAIALTVERDGKSLEVGARLVPNKTMEPTR